MTNERELMSSVMGGAHHDRSDEPPCWCILCQNGEDCTLAVALTGHVSLLEWMVIIMAL